MTGRRDSVERRGLFVTLDGQGGAGKSTTTDRLRGRLTDLGHDVHATTQPSRDRLGAIARATDTYRGHALACLVAADRYHHLSTEIRPALARGRIVLCDRYVASSYVLQRMDGVPVEFIESLNSAADGPDLAVILTVDPMVAVRRIDGRGAHSRFESGLADARREAALYGDTARRLERRGWTTLVVDTTHDDVDHVVGIVSEHITRLVSVLHRGTGDA